MLDTKFLSCPDNAEENLARSGGRSCFFTRLVLAADVCCSVKPSGAGRASSGSFFSAHNKSSYSGNQERKRLVLSAEMDKSIELETVEQPPATSGSSHYR